MSKIKKIQPVISYFGSKFRMIDTIFSLLELKNNDNFLDLFGGSGIVGINASKIIGCNTFLNDFDNIFPLKLKYALKNILSFEGNMKNYTLSRLNYFIKRLDNGWLDKLNFYNKQLTKLNLIHKDFNNIDVEFIKNNKINKIYVDPPYFGVKKLYKSSFDTKQHINLFLKLEKLKKITKIVVSYNDCKFIRSLYKDWKIIEFKKTNHSGVSKTKKIVTELLITNGI
ncbi:Hypothetical protein MALK_6640 [Metamycoplasma alkalescens 14918]|uniref:site-specific DNA-methyltransferase (adenine-specific) n=1 Tax=Metamycoplasma alkalescens 14918 TaxID=1188234 RepID=N9UA91_9BACT|nr:DNA adenine methylase [Metamycoplasma alkalescens]ENY53636.1 Hypothetical protein MALK_6640 [Metamycoplasma alkalescens 14918]